MISFSPGTLYNLHIYSIRLRLTRVLRVHSESSIDHWASADDEAARASEQLVKLKPLVWHFDAPMMASIHDAHQKLMKITKAIDIHVLRFEAFAKGLIKRYDCRLLLTIVIASLSPHCAIIVDLNCLRTHFVRLQCRYRFSYTHTHT